MGWLDRRRRPAQAAPQIQLRQPEKHPFGAWDGYVPLHGGETALYRSIREAVPIVDAAILKLIRLVGGAEVEAADPAARAGLRRFLNQVPTGRGQRGLESFLDCYLDSLLTCGRAVGEVVLDRKHREVAALLCANVADIEIREGESPMDFALCVRQGGGEPVELPRQDLLLFTPFQPEICCAPCPSSRAFCSRSTRPSA